MQSPHRRMDAPWRQTTLRLSPCNGRRTSVVTGTPRKPPNGRIPSALWEQRPFPHPLPSQFAAPIYLTQRRTFTAWRAALTVLGCGKVQSSLASPVSASFALSLITVLRLKM